MVEIEKYGWVNALRGYAILLVILIHTSEMFYSSSWMQIITHTGDLGVQLFFIMSSFTLFNSYYKRKNVELSHTKNDFFIRRFFRIAPFYYIAGLIYVCHTIFIKNENVNIIHLLSNYTFTNGLFLPAINYIPPGGWSVGVEMLFYLAIPWLCSHITSLKRSMLFLLFSIVISNIINALLFYYVTYYTTSNWIGARQWSLYFWFPNQFPVFVFGIILYFVYKEIRVSEKTGNRLLILSLISFLILAFVKFELTYPEYFFQREYVYSLLFTLFAIGVYSTRNSLIINSLIQKIGIVSFSMYLNHFIILAGMLYCNEVILCELKIRLNFPVEILRNDFIFLVWYIIIVFTTFIFSKLTYKYIEFPGINLGKKVIMSLYPESKYEK